MTKPLIKIIKRCARIVIQSPDEPAVKVNSAKAERKTEREMVKTIGGWIEERREQSRLATIIARGNPFGELLVSKG